MGFGRLRRKNSLTVEKLGSLRIKVTHSLPLLLEAFSLRK
jgi:hypothetical protein